MTQSDGPPRSEDGPPRSGDGPPRSGDHWIATRNRADEIARDQNYPIALRKAALSIVEGIDKIDAHSRKAELRAMRDSIRRGGES